MKAIAVLVMVSALALLVVPAYTDCQSRGYALTLQSGAQVPMKCHWAGRAEAAVGAPALLLGAALMLSERRNARRLIGAGAFALGIVGILLPTSLIGVCQAAAMPCNVLMRPMLLLASGIMAASGLAVFLLSPERDRRSAAALA